MPTSRQSIATDCSFVKKSGKGTYGIEYFYNGNGSAGKAEKGLEIAVIAVVDVDSKQAYLRYVYTGEQKSRGRKLKYDGKVDLTDVRECKVRLAYIRDCRDPQRVGIALLFSTDINLEALEILAFYKSRFQIEFIFRDAKQFTGLSDCQVRDLTKLDFHFNASLMVLNLAKFDARQSHLSVHPDKPFVFSMASYKRLAFNRHLLERFISLLDLDP